ncbi:MAG TPA: hypothetical protein VHY37_11040 [Tepidisphaeraceae bacterium]|jgi:hypothetical protein|nr:hypothetical protein [Tepidisphaeraceae bacterium]
MNEDPIVEEVRREREKYAASFNFDIRAMVADLRLQQQREKRTPISLPPHKPGDPGEPTKKAG